MIQKNYDPTPDQGGGNVATLPPPTTLAATPTPTEPGTANNAAPPPPNQVPASTPGKDFDTERDDALSAAFKVDGKHQQQPRERPVKSVEEAPKVPDDVETAATVKKEATPPTPGDELDQLEKLPAPKARDAQSQAKYDSDWQAIKEKYSNLVRAERAKLSKIIEERDAIRAEFTGKLTEAEKKAQTLEGYRAAIDLQSDPAFIEKYEKPIEDKKAEMVSYLNSIGIPKEAIASLNNVWSDDYSMRKITKQLEDQDAVVGETFREHVVELRRMQKEHGKAVRDANLNRDKLIKESREQQLRKGSEREVAMKGRFDEILKMREGEGPAATPRWGFLVQMAVPSNATPEQRAAIEKHNQQANIEQEQVQQLARSEIPEERIDQAVITRAFPLMVQRFQAVLKEHDAMTKELAAIKKSSSFSSTPAAPSKTPQPARKTDASMDGGAAIDSLFGVKG